MQGPTPEQVREKLRAVAWPGFDQDIVAAGFVKQIDVRDSSVRIGFEVLTRRTDRAAGPHARSRRLGRRDSLKRASATIAAVAESIERSKQDTGNRPVESPAIHRKLIP